LQIKNPKSMHLVQHGVQINLNEIKFLDFVLAMEFMIFT